ncbi:MAG: ATP-binding protein [Anaerolineae bacterium]|nr:ATP-binding protein [Anaerolineae bacterium]
MTDAENLDQWFPRNDPTAYQTGIERLGVVVGGSLSKGLVVKLDPLVSIEDLAVGRYVVVHGTHKRFFCMINDVTLDSTNPAIQSDPPNVAGDDFLSAIYSGSVAYGTVHVAPMLSIELDGAPKPVKTIPSHFMPVFSASAEDVNDVFGTEDATHFHVGAPLELEHTRINLDLRRLVERSVGVFGKSGTGKSFLTRVLLAGLIHKGVGVSLIFDMHNDYGWQITSENGYSVKGLKQLFDSKVTILTLDAESSRRRNAKFDFEVKLGYDEVEPEDLEQLRVTMNFSDAMIDAIHTLSKRWGKGWIRRLLKGDPDDIEDLEMNTTIASGTLIAVQRRMERFERWDFLVAEAPPDSVKQIISILVDQQKSVVLEFGRYGNSLDAYMLVANYLTRRIHEAYVEHMEKALGDAAHEPPQLLITIEEAHKFLDPKIANQTTFGIIAREMRKYNVTLLVVDQRPSAIDEEVMSQVGTRVTALLDNERDINAVLNGISGAGGLREVLARLDTKQQAIIMGHAVPMPVVIRPRTYDEDFYASFENLSPATTSRIRKTLGTGDTDRRLR